METTQNYALNKPAASDYVDIAVLNENMDKLDAHAHGSITAAGKVGSAADLPLFTGTGGAVEAVSRRDALIKLGALGLSRELSAGDDLDLIKEEGIYYARPANIAELIHAPFASPFYMLVLNCYGNHAVQLAARNGDSVFKTRVLPSGVVPPPWQDVAVNVESGEYTFTGVVKDMKKTAQFTFDVPYKAVPRVLVTVRSNEPAKSFASVFSITTTGFNIAAVNTKNTDDIVVEWAAFPA